MDAFLKYFEMRPQTCLLPDTITRIFPLIASIVLLAKRGQRLIHLDTVLDARILGGSLEATELSMFTDSDSPTGNPRNGVLTELILAVYIVRPGPNQCSATELMTVMSDLLHNSEQLNNPRSADFSLAQRIPRETKSFCK